MEWAVNAQGQMPARDYYLTLSAADQAKIQARFNRLAQFGHISNEEHFKKVADHVWEFKSFQLRFFGDFRPGYRFVVAHATRKKKDRLDSRDLETTMRVLAEHDARETR